MLECMEGKMRANVAEQVSGPRVDDTPTISTRALTKMYPGGTLAVDRLDLNVPRGEFFGLLGPNGAGKTTTVGMLTTRVLPTGGEMWIGGFSVRKQAVAVKRIIGVVTQFNTLDRRLTSWENLYYHGRYFGLSRTASGEQADRVLKLVQLTEKQQTFVDALSGGMQQRLLIGRALVHQPEVLFLDEPTSGIDPQGRIALWDILMKLHGEGLTILLTTHYMEEAEMLCQRVAVMDHGRILAIGSPAELKANLGAATVVSLLAEPVTNDLVSGLEALPGVRSVQPDDNGVQIYAEAADGLLPLVVEKALALGAEVHDISVRTPTLETVFISLTGRNLRE